MICGLTERPQPVTTAADLRARQRQSHERIMAVQQKAMAARAALADSTVTKSSQDRSVTLTVNPGGGLVRLTFGPAAEKKALSQLATTIMQTYRGAAAEAVDTTIRIMRELAGDDGGVLDVLRANVPTDLETDA